MSFSLASSQTPPPTFPWDRYRLTDLTALMMASPLLGEWRPRYPTLPGWVSLLGLVPAHNSPLSIN